MTLEQASLVAQIVSAVAVIASLIFVGFQLRHATAAIRAASLDAYSILYTQLIQTIVEDAEFASIWSRGLADPRSLKEEEWVRFVAYSSALFRAYESSRVQWVRGRLDEEHWRTVEQQALTFASQPGMIAAWKVRGHWYSPEFRAWFEAQARTEVRQVYSRE